MKPGHGLDQDFLSLAVKLGREDTQARCITAGPGQRVNQPLPGHIFGNSEDCNSRRRLLYRANCNVPGDQCPVRAAASCNA